MTRDLKSTFATAAPIARAVIVSSRTSAIATGIAVGLGVWIIVQNVLVTFGLNSIVSLAILCSGSLSLVIGRILASRFPTLSTTGLATIIAGGWLSLLPSITSLAVNLLSALPSHLLLAIPSRIACMTAAGFFVAGCPLACCGVIGEQPMLRRHRGSFLLAVAGGLLLAVLIAGPLFGLASFAYALAILAGAAWFFQQWRGSRSVPADQPVSRPLGDSGGFVALWQSIAGWTTFLAAGLIAGVLARVLVQLMAGAPYLLATGAAAIIVGVVAGMACHSSRKSSETSNAAPAPMAGNLPGALVIAAAGLLPLAFFESLISLQLHANGAVSTVAWLLLIRSGLVAACFLPLGFGLGLVASRGLARNPSGFAGTAFSFCGGLAVAPWLIAFAGPVALMLAAVGTVVIGNIPAISLGRGHRRWMGVGYAGAMGLLALLALRSPHYAPARAAGLLFDGSTLRSWQNGVPQRLLLVMDDSRLVSERETPEGTLTTWNLQGSVRLLRLDGVPLAVRQSQPALGPRPPAEVLRVLLPIVLHDDPQSLLLLSDPAGVGGEIAAEFPLRRIVCCEAIAGKSEFRDATESDGSRPSRVIHRSVTGRLALISEDRAFDIIVSSPGHPAIFGNAANFTQGFYRDAAAHLNEGGIFCQRVRYTDLGPAPLRTIVRTMRGAFRDVAATELERGVLVLFGTNDSSEPLFSGLRIDDEGLAERLRRPQVRRLLASLGWDWSVPFQLKVIPTQALASFAGGSSNASGKTGKEGPPSAIPANTALSGYLAHRTPLEMMRWGAKGAELAHATAGLTTPLLALSASQENRAEIADRIKMVNQQHDLMFRYADQPWFYRKAVKKHLEDSPQSTIEKVNGQLERVLHPVEKRRLAYFSALDTAIRTLNEPSLKALEAFASPYDPAITYFLHHEIAPLYHQLGAEGLREELVHRLQAVYFADPRDRSIRNIVTTINLVVEHPRIIPDPSARYDQVNALIEMLLRRWERRGQEPGSPEQALVDVGKSLDALVRALPMMAQLAPQAGVASDQWDRRADAIERMILGPLREFRVELLPHQRRTAGKNEQPDHPVTQASGSVPSRSL